MQISFQDFVPQIKSESFFSADYETLEETIARINDWISANSIKVINVETVVRPNRDDGKADESQLGMTLDYSYWYQFVRVWYVVE